MRYLQFGIEPASTGGIPLYRFFSPPVLTNPSLLCRRDLIVSIGYNAVSTTTPAVAPATNVFHFG